ncbi:hypothetical protein FQR65_LT01038 [Abscondita terminalis]|nr:hypothetical protein FQR65_LT01038 [Abscondita terminalis]
MLDSKSTLIYVFNDYNYLTDDLENPQIKINARYPIHGKQEIQRCNYIFQGKTLGIVQDNINSIALGKMWNVKDAKRNKFIFIVENGNKFDIFTVLWKNWILDFVVIYVEKSGIKVLTSDPLTSINECGQQCHTYKEQSCFDVTPITFQQIITNYNKCLIIFASLDPVYAVKNKYGKTVDLIAKLVETILNASVIQIHTNEQNYIKDTQFGIELYEDLYGFDSDGTDVFFYDDFVWISSEPDARELLTNFFCAFSLLVWIMIIIVLILVIVAWCIIEYCQIGAFACTNWYEICFFGISLMFGVSISKIPKMTSLKILLASYLIYILHIHTAYTSDIIDNLVVPKFDDLINSIEELADSDVPVIIGHISTSYYFLEDYENFTLYNNIKKKLVLVKEYSPEYYKNYKKFFIVALRSMFFLEWGRQNLYTKNDKFRSHFFSTEITGSYRSVFRTFRSHFIIPSVNKVINIFMESGMHQAVYYKKQHSNFSLRVVNITYHEGEHKKWSKPLGLKHFYSVLVIFALGLTLYIITSHTMWNTNDAKRSKFIFIIEDENISNMFMTLWNIPIIYFSVIFVNGSNMEVLISYPLLSENHCGKKFNRYEKQNCFDTAPITFEKTIMNYNKCLVMFAKFIKKEYSIIKNKYQNTVNLIVDLVKSVLNTSVVEIYTNQKNYSKDTRYGIGVYEDTYGYDYDGSDVFFYDDFVWISTEPSESLLLDTFFSAFSAIVWIVIFIVLIAIIIVWCCIIAYNQGKAFTCQNYFEICSYGISLMCAVSISKIPRITSLKVLLTCYLIYILHIHIAYTSDIIDNLVVPKFHGLIKSVEELADSDMPIIILEESGLYFEGGHENFSLFNKIKNKIVKVKQYSPKNYESYKKYFLLGLRSMYFIERNRQNLPTKNDKFRSHFFSNQITGSFRCVFRSTNGHYFISSLNKIITIFIESGLQHTVYEKRKITNATIRVVNITYYEQEHTKWSKPLRLKHFYSILIIFVFGCGLSVIVLLLEYVTARNSKHNSE